MKAMIFQSWSALLMVAPIDGIGACTVPVAQALVALLFQIHRAQRDQPEQHVVGIAPEPDALGQGGADAAAAAAAVTFVAAGQPELFDEIRVVLRQLGVIRVGAVQLALGHLLHQLERRGRIPRLATCVLRCLGRSGNAADAR